MAANQLMVLAEGKITCRPNQAAKSKTTPTTAPVTADKVVVKASFPSSFSIEGAPRNIHKKHGVNVPRRNVQRCDRPHF